MRHLESWAGLRWPGLLRAALLSLLLWFAPSLPVTAMAPAAAQQGLLGDWVTPDKSIVEIYTCGGRLCIKIARIAPELGRAKDELNPDASQRDRPLCGLVIGRDFERKDDAHAEGGKLYDPDSGHIYSGTLTLAGNSTLKLHGFIGISIFGRSELWHRADLAPSECNA